VNDRGVQRIGQHHLLQFEVVRMVLVEPRSRHPIFDVEWRPSGIFQHIRQMTEFQ
jgi:hypothetical protein